MSKTEKVGFYQYDLKEILVAGNVVVHEVCENLGRQEINHSIGSEVVVALFTLIETVKANDHTLITI